MRVLLVMCLSLSSVSWASTTVVKSEPDSTVQLLRATLSKTSQQNLELEEALTIALEENRATKLASAEVGRAKAAYQAKLASILPDIVLGRSFGHYQGAMQTVYGDFLTLDHKSQQPQMAIRFSLLQGGRQILLSRMAKKDLAAQRENEQAVLQQVLKQTACLYYELQRSLADVAVARQQLKEAENQLELGKSRVALGVGSQLEVLQFETQLIDTQEQLVESIRASEAAALRLNEILNLPAFVQVVPNTHELAIRPLLPKNTDLSDLLAYISQKNPRILALTHKIQSFTQLFKPSSLLVALLPEVYVQTRLGRVGTDMDNSRSFRDVALGVNYTMQNLWVGRTLQYKEFKANIQGLLAQLEIEKNTIKRALSEALLTSEAKQVQIHLARAKVAVAEKSYVQALEDFMQGKCGNVNVLTAQSHLNLARRNLNALIQEYNQAQTNVIYEMGLASVETLTEGVKTL